MSQFHKNIFKSKLLEAEAKLGFDFSEDIEGDTDLDTHTEFNNDDDDMRLIPSSTNTNTVTTIAGDIDETPLPWSDAFSNNDVYCNDEGYCFQTYFQPPCQKSKKGIEIDNDNADNDDETPVIFIAHHGAGSCGLSFAELCQSVTLQSKEGQYFTTPGFFTFDARGHGNTNLINRGNEKLDAMNYNVSIRQLVEDFRFLINHLVKKLLTKYSKMSLFLIGHSLGGSVTTKFTYDILVNKTIEFQYIGFIKGLTMIDIVEETAVSALGAMNSYLNNLPKSFKSIDAAVDWYLRNGLVNNVRSCRYSVPSLIYRDNNGVYKFVLDLRKTQQYWDDWFTALSEQFTKIPKSVSKLLILANNDYLDKNLIIGQMQGKYQLIVFQSAANNMENYLTTSTKVVNDSKKIGHFIHEDIPNKFSLSLLDFVERNDNGGFHRETSNPQLDLINKLNKKWGVRK
jgi:protein phosphatase methylesterase 1